MTERTTVDGDQPNENHYHLKELAIARDPTARGHCLPAIPPNCRRVLDVGCGAGQTLLALNLPPVVEALGVDVDPAAIAFGQRLAPHLRLICAVGERLPPEIRDVDFVYSRVALPYMDISVALAEMARVLRPGGMLWVALHPARMTLRQLSRAIGQGRISDVAGCCYVLACGSWLWRAATWLRKVRPSAKCNRVGLINSSPGRQRHVS